MTNAAISLARRLRTGVSVEQRPCADGSVRRRNGPASTARPGWPCSRRRLSRSISAASVSPSSAVASVAGGASGTRYSSRIQNGVSRPSRPRAVNGIDRCSRHQASAFFAVRCEIAARRACPRASPRTAPPTGRSSAHRTAASAPRPRPWAAPARRDRRPRAPTGPLAADPTTAPSMKPNPGACTCRTPAAVLIVTDCVDGSAAAAATSTIVTSAAPLKTAPDHERAAGVVGVQREAAEQEEVVGVDPETGGQPRAMTASPDPTPSRRRRRPRRRDTGTPATGATSDRRQPARCRTCSSRAACRCPRAKTARRAAPGR